MRKMTVGVFLVVVAGLFASVIFGCWLRPINLVEIINRSQMDVLEATLVVGSNRLDIGTVWQNEVYEYSFRSPGEGVVRFSSMVAGNIFVCEVGYVDSSLKTSTRIEIDDGSNVNVSFDYEPKIGTRHKTPCRVEP